MGYPELALNFLHIDSRDYREAFNLHAYDCASFPKTNHFGKSCTILISRNFRAKPEWPSVLGGAGASVLAKECCLFKFIFRL